jgi:hypothetical protein
MQASQLSAVGDFNLWVVVTPALGCMVLTWITLTYELH